MTHKLSDKFEDFIPKVEPETHISTETKYETTESTANEDFLNSLKEIDPDTYEDDEYDSHVIIDVFNFDRGQGLVDIPIYIWPESPFIFFSGDDKGDAVLLSPTGNCQFIAVRPSNRKVYTILRNVLSDLNGTIHLQENTAAIHRNLIEYVLFELNKAGLTLFMTSELVEEIQPMEDIDFDYHVRIPMMKSTKGKGNSILTLMSPLLRSQYGSIGFILTDKENDMEDNTRLLKISSNLDKQQVGLIRSALYHKFGHQKMLIIVPDDYRQITLQAHLDKHKRIDCKVVTPGKAEAQLATGTYPRLIVLDIMDPNILAILGDPDVANLIRKVEITYGIAYGGGVVQAPEPVFYELQELIGPIRLVL